MFALTIRHSNHRHISSKVLFQSGNLVDDGIAQAVRFELPEIAVAAVIDIIIHHAQAGFVQFVFKGLQAEESDRQYIVVIFNQTVEFLRADGLLRQSGVSPYVCFRIMIGSGYRVGRENNDFGGISTQGPQF